ncbi:MAG: anthranilate phosphoribosyltransferase [Candidatus Obscuribacterales bacterium]|nr:anthranilate phosphoribosyltransferase [Candidatus Obscuribacterales bacterium]
MQLTSTLVDDIFNARLAPPQLSEALKLLTPESIDRETLKTIVDAGFAVCDHPTLKNDILTIDCSGTGGSGLQHFNVSTTVAFVLAAQGIAVTKFGNRAMSGTCGSFDLLEAVGIDAISTPVKIDDTLAETKLSFLFAPRFYPTLKGLSEIRRKLGIKTIFNFIGPLLNPVRPAYRLMGVSNSHMQTLIAIYLETAPSFIKGLIVSGENGLDELCYPGLTRILTVEDGRTTASPYCVDSSDENTFTTTQSLLNVDDNVKIFLDIIESRDTQSIFYNQVCLNAGGGFVAAKVVNDIDAGCALAKELIASGQVKEKFESTRRFYAKYSC